MAQELTPRIQPLADPEPEVAELLAQTGLRDGRPLNVFATLARHPRLLKRFNVLGGFFLTRGLLPARDRELVILRSAWRAGSEYEFGQHTLIGRQAGLAEAEIQALAGGDREWEARDRALLAVADELSERPELSDVAWEAVRAHLGEAEAMELILLAGFYRMLAALLNTVRVEREAGVPGWP